MEVTHLESNLNEVVIANYEGNYDDETGEYKGFGVAKLDNDCVYEGKFLKGLFHGKGKFTWSDGVVYEGDFHRNHIQGQGTYTYTDGSVYVGAVENGKRHGTGKLTNSGGQIYDGSWKDGLRHGVGKMYYNEEQTITYTGEWKENNRHGYGVMRYISGNTYEGHWQDDHKHGFGVMIWRDMDETYIGEWANDQPHGFGEHIWGDSNAKTVKKQTCNMYRGEFLNGQRSGRGTFFYMNGATYTGFWQEDLKHGPGVFVHPDGKMIVGDYDLNRLVTVTPSTNTTAATAVPANNNNSNNNSKLSSTVTGSKTNLNATTSKPGSASSSAPPSASGTAKKGNTAAPSIATKLSTIPENTTSGNSNSGNNNAAPPGTANVNASSLHPNNISVQYHLHILDILAKFPTHPRLLDFEHPAAKNLLTATSSLSTAGGNKASLSMSMTGSNATNSNSNVDYAKTVHERSAVMHEMERLLLKYNTHLKQIYRRFNEQSNRLRQREMVIIPPLAEGVVPYSLTEKTWKLRKAALTARAFHRRVHCASLREAIQYLREIGLVNGQEITAYDVTQIFRTMKRQHERHALDLYREYLQQIQALEEEAAMLELEAQEKANNEKMLAAIAAENANSSRYRKATSPTSSVPVTPQQSQTEMVNTLTIEDIENSEEYNARHRQEQYAKAVAIKQKVQEAQIAIGQLLDDYLLFDDAKETLIPENEDDPFHFQFFPSSSSSSPSSSSSMVTTGAASFYRFGIGQQPLLEHEFMELFVRVALEFALRHGYDPSIVTDNNLPQTGKQVCWAWMTPYQVMEKFLAEKVFPLANHGTQDVSELVQEMYDENVQDLFHQRPNKLLDSAFSPASLAALSPPTSNNQADGSAADHVDIPHESKHSAQTLMLWQWEALKRYAVEENGLNQTEMYPVPLTGLPGWVRVKDFLAWFLRNNKSADNAAETTDATTVFASLHSSITVVQLLRIVATDPSSLNAVVSAMQETATSATAEESNSEINANVEGNPETTTSFHLENAAKKLAGEGNNEDIITVGARKMVFEDFAEAIVRIWSQNERIVQVIHPMFGRNATENGPGGAAAGEDNESLPDMLDNEDGMMAEGLGGWLDAGSSVSSSVLSNQLLHRLLLWLLTQRSKVIEAEATASAVTN